MGFQLVNSEWVALWEDHRTEPLRPAAEGKYALENGQAWERRLRDAGNQNPNGTSSTQIHPPLFESRTYTLGFPMQDTVRSAEHTQSACLSL